MERRSNTAFLAAAREEENYARTVSYLADRLRQFLRRQERVLICYPDQGQYGMGNLVSRSVRELGGIPLMWGPDYRWQALLKQAFVSRATAVVGTPLIILGLAKLARYTSTPLYIRNVVLAGAACESWMSEGIRQTLDAFLWGCFDPSPGLVIGGFSCSQGEGVHLRADLFDVRMEDPSGDALPDGELGRIALSSRRRPELIYTTGEMARLDRRPCPCGNPSPRLTDFHRDDESVPGLRESLLSWTSILDFHAVRSSAGLELEAVYFPGQRLPKFPTCAKRVLRPWNPGTDMPMGLFPKYDKDFLEKD